MGLKRLEVLHSASTPLPVLAAALERVDRSTHVLGGKFTSPAVEPPPKLVDEETTRLMEFLTKISFEGQPDTASRTMRQAIASGNQALGLQDIAMQLRDIPGRKSLIWITEVDDAFSWTVTSREERLASTYELPVELLNEASVSLYIAIHGGTGVAVTRDRVSGMMVSGLGLLAEATGGKLVEYRLEGLNNAIASALTDCGSYYLVRLHVPSSKPGNLPFEIDAKVTVTASNTRARVRKHFWSLP